MIPACRKALQRVLAAAPAHRTSEIRWRGRSLDRGSNPPAHFVTLSDPLAAGRCQRFGTQLVSNTRSRHAKQHHPQRRTCPGTPASAQAGDFFRIASSGTCQRTLTAQSTRWRCGDAVTTPERHESGESGEQQGESIVGGKRPQRPPGKTHISTTSLRTLTTYKWSPQSRPRLPGPPRNEGTPGLSSTTPRDRQTAHSECSEHRARDGGPARCDLLGEISHGLGRCASAPLHCRCVEVPQPSIRNGPAGVIACLLKTSCLLWLVAPTGRLPTGSAAQSVEGQALHAKASSVTLAPSLCIAYVTTWPRDHPAHSGSVRPAPPSRRGDCEVKAQ
jgi:hypothetical protein